MYTSAHRVSALTVQPSTPPSALSLSWMRPVHATGSDRRASPWARSQIGGSSSAAAPGRRAARRGGRRPVCQGTLVGPLPSSHLAASS